MNGELRRELLDLILEHSFEKRKVVLASGRESDFYLDLRRTLMRPRGVRLAGRAALRALADEGVRPDAVGGMAVGAVPFVSAVLGAADDDARFSGLLGFFVRKEAKAHGLGRQIEGGFAPGQEVVLLEDTTTTGGSTIDALRIVREAGGEVLCVVSLVDRGEGAAPAFEAAGVKFSPVFTRADLPV
ncbi:MAG: orotate phosphoribosyltransferase [Planctomycetota bacterium]